MHKSFFVEGKYKAIRQLLDSDEEAAAKERTRLILDQPEDFIESLNFFELVAYLNECKNLALKDVTALLGYYLDLFIDHSDLRAYIKDTQRNGFEYLDALLDKIKTAR